MNAYMERVLEDVKKRNANEPEFLQAVEEVFKSIEGVMNQHPEYEASNLLGRLTEPERQISFRVTWVDDNGEVHVNRGYRVQFNGAIGPYKGGLRFHPSVYIGIIKFLGFEQIFKNALTGLPIGGGKGGSDFDPRGKSDGEIMRIRGAFENGVLTGKGMSYGGSLIRPEATGFGAVYFADAVMKHCGDTLEGKTVSVSGFGNVAWGVCTKMTEAGAKVVTLSGPDGYIYDEDGINTPEKIEYLLEMRASGRDKVQDYADKFGVPFYPGEKPWGVKVDIAMPSATQNDVNMEQAEKIVANGVKYYIEVANMPTTNDAMDYLQSKGVIMAPSKAVNAGGVGVSALEMSQNSERLFWTEEEVDGKLRQIMKNIHDNAASAAEEYGFGYNLVAGANIAGFLKVAQAMTEQGIF